MSTGTDIITGQWVQDSYRDGALRVSVERLSDGLITNLPMERFIEFSPGAIAGGATWTSETLDLGPYPRVPARIYILKVSTVLTLLNEELELECSQDGVTWWPAVMPDNGLSTLVKAVAGARAFGTSGVPVGRYARIRLKAGLTATGADTKVRVLY
jgi:hypothetical protein